MATTFVEYSGNGGATKQFTFPSYQSSDVKVRVDGVLKTASTHYNITNYTTTGGGDVVFTSGNIPSSGTIRIYRDTSVDVAKATYTAGSSVKAADLNNNNTQLLYRAQEEQVPNLIQSYDIEGDAIDGTKIADNSINSEHYVDGSIDHVHLANDVIDGDNIQNDVINSEHYAAGSIDEEHLSNSAITSNKIADNAVTTTEILNGAVTTAKINNLAVTTAKLDNNGVTTAKIADGAVVASHLASDSVTSAKIADGAVTVNKLGTNAVTVDKIADNAVGAGELASNAVTTAKIADDAVTDAKIADGTLDGRYFTETELLGGALDGRYFTETESDARYFNISSGETIKDGDTFPDNDTTIATTAAINDRIIDLIDDVGGFDIIASEQHFPNTNPQGTTGQSAVLSIKEASTNLVPSGTTVTISNGNLADNANITITGVTSTIPTGFGFLVESTSTTHTYAFHRLVPKATEVTTVAGNITNINAAANNETNINAAVSNASNINAAVSNASNITAVAGNASNINAAVSNASNINSAVSNASNITTTASNITNVNNVGNNVTNVNSVSNSAGANQTFTVTVQNVSGNKYFIDGVQTPVLKLARGKTYTFDMSDSSNSGHPLAFRDSSDNSYTTGVTTSGTAGSSGATVVIVVAANAPSSLKYYCTSHGNAMGNTITVIDDNVGTVAGSISNVNTVGGAIANVNTTAGSIANVNTVATNINDINDFTDKYRVGANNPTSSLDTGDLFFNTTSNSLKVYTGSAWVDGVTATGNFAVVTGNTFTGSNNHNDNVKSIYGTGSDLEIYHDGSNSFIKDTGTGGLKIMGSDLYLRNPSDEDMIYATSDGAVNLYYDNNKKFETTSTGVEVGGKIVADELSLETATAGSQKTLKLKNTNASAGTNEITFSSTTSGTNFEAASIRNGVPNHLNGSLQFKTANGSGLQTAVVISNDQTTTFNAGVTVTGTVAATSYTGDGSNLSGINTDLVSDTSPQLGGNLESNSNDIVFGDGDKARFGASNDLQIRHDSNNSIISHNGGGDLLINTADGEKVYVDTSEIIFRNAGSNETLFKGTQNGAVKLHYDDSKKFETTSAGCGVTGNLTFADNGQALFGAGDDLKIYHDTSSGGKNYIESPSTDFAIRVASGNRIEVNGTTGDVALQGSSGKNFLWDNSEAILNLNDNAQLTFGTGNDFSIRHDGTYNRFKAANFIFNNAAGNESIIEAYQDGAVNLYYNNSKKLETDTNGIFVNGALRGDSVDLADSKKILLGSGDDCEIYHNGNHAYIDNNTGYLTLQGNYGVLLQRHDGSENLITAYSNGASELFYDGSKKLATTSGGVDITGDLRIADNEYLMLGTHDDLQITHSPNNGYIKNYTGGLYIQGGTQNNSIYIRPKEGEEGIKASSNSNVELYYDNSKKLETTSSGVDITGGLNLTDHLTLDDTDKVKLGNGEDLQIYHDGSHSYISNSTGNLRIGNTHDNNIIFRTNDANKWHIDGTGHFLPDNNNTHDIGTTSNRVRNIYTNDLHLSNEGSSNDVDGSWGDWTIQEGESDLFLKNNRSGKKYKFNLTEVS